MNWFAQGSHRWWHSPVIVILRIGCIFDLILCDFPVPYALFWNRSPLGLRRVMWHTHELNSEVRKSWRQGISFRAFVYLFTCYCLFSIDDSICIPLYIMTIVVNANCWCRRVLMEVKSPLSIDMLSISYPLVPIYVRWLLSSPHIFLYLSS